MSIETRKLAVLIHRAETIFCRGAEGRPAAAEAGAGGGRGRACTARRPKGPGGAGHRAVASPARTPRARAQRPACSSLSAVASMPSAPRGAVTRMESTATERTSLPQGRPSERGTPPMAACTVALGR